MAALSSSSQLTSPSSIQGTGITHIATATTVRLIACFLIRSRAGKYNWRSTPEAEGEASNTRNVGIVQGIIYLKVFAIVSDIQVKSAGGVGEKPTQGKGVSRE